MMNKLILLLFLVIFSISYVLAQDDGFIVEPNPEPISEPKTDPVPDQPKEKPNPEPISEPKTDPVPEIIDDGFIVEPNPEDNGHDDFNDGDSSICATLYCQEGYDCVEPEGCVPRDDYDGEDYPYCPDIVGWEIIGKNCVYTTDGCAVEFGNLESCEERVSSFTDDFNVPKGCYVVESNNGILEYKCKDQPIHDFDKLADECLEYGGNFDVYDGNPECSIKGKGSFSGYECPDNEAVERLRAMCDGRLEFYDDERGCNAVSCVSDFYGKDYYERGRERYGDDPKRLAAWECQNKGGKFLELDKGARCLERERRDYRGGDFQRESIDAIDLLKIAIKIETVTISLETVRDKLNDISLFYAERDEEKSKVYLNGAAKMEGAIARLEEMRFGIAENADNLNDEDRRVVLRDIQNTKNTIKDIAIEILTGKRITRKDEDRERFERIRGSNYEDYEFDDYHESYEEGIDILEAISNCDKDSPEDPFEFQPDPNIIVRLEGLDDQGRCIMKPQPLDIPFDAPVELRLPPDVYNYFTGPELLLRDDVECIGIGCRFMLNSIREEADRDDRLDRRRFGEDEFDNHGPGSNDFFEDRNGPGRNDPVGGCMADCIREECTNRPPEPSCVESRVRICEERCFSEANNFRFDEEGHDEDGTFIDDFGREGDDGRFGEGEFAIGNVVRRFFDRLGGQ
jgi:hypothetical protein